MLPTLSAEEIAKHGTRLGAGVHREGYAVTLPDGTDYCIKLARGTYGAEASVAELRSWESLQAVEPSIRQNFCDIVAADPDGWFVVMPLCSTDEAGYWDWLNAVGYDLSGAGIVGDLHSGNVMRHPDGRMVVTDYGFGVDTSSLDSFEPGAYQRRQEEARRRAEERRLAWEAQRQPQGDLGPVEVLDSMCRASYGDQALEQCDSCGWYFAQASANGGRPCQCTGCARHINRRRPAVDLGVLARQVGKHHRNRTFVCDRCGLQNPATGHCEQDAKHDGGSHWTACR